MDPVSTLNTAVAVTKTIVTNAIGLAYGPSAKAFYELAFGNPLVLTQIAAMGEKKELGKLEPGDYAVLLKVVADIAVATAVVGGATIAVPIGVAWAITGIGLSIYENRNNIQTFIDNFQQPINSGIPDIGGDPFTGMPWPGVDSSTNRDYTAAVNILARDPLVLDLDGDGIETTGINPSAPLLFDMGGDGLKTATGWIKADDGLVVLDRNGNGLIDSGRELFGDATVLANGPRAGLKAANGFEALADLDGNADGVINSADALFSSLRVWQDSNQDAVSQASELHTLAELGIASISASGTPGALGLGQGNLQVMSGSFTRTNGSTGMAGVAELPQMATAHGDKQISLELPIASKFIAKNTRFICGNSRFHYPFCSHYSCHVFPTRRTSSGPLCLRRGAQPWVDQGSRCVSAASLARPRPGRAPQAAPFRGQAGTGVALSLVTYFRRSERKLLARRSELPASQIQSSRRTLRRAKHIDIAPVSIVINALQISGDWHVFPSSANDAVWRNAA